MKLKALALSIALAAGIFAANAQTATKGNDVFVGFGGGIISTLNGGFNTPAFYGNIMVGKYITPVWGVRRCCLLLHSLWLLPRRCIAPALG